MIGEDVAMAFGAWDFSPPVTASDIALSPILGFDTDFEGAIADLGELLAGDLLLLCDVTTFMLGFLSYSNLVTVGEVRSVERDGVDTASLAEEFRKWPIPWYILAAGEAMAATVSLIESTLPNLE